MAKSERPKVKNAARPFRSPTMIDLNTPFIPSVSNFLNADIIVSIAVGMIARNGIFDAIFSPKANALLKIPIIFSPEKN